MRVPQAQRSGRGPYAGAVDDAQLIRGLELIEQQIRLLSERAGVGATLLEAKRVVDSL